MKAKFELLPREIRVGLHKQLTNGGFLKKTATMMDVKDFFNKNERYFNGTDFSFPKNEMDAYGNPRNEWSIRVNGRGQVVHVFPTERGTIYWGEDGNEKYPYFVVFSMSNHYFSDDLSVEYRRATQQATTDKVNELKKLITTKHG